VENKCSKLEVRPKTPKSTCWWLWAVHLLL